MSSIVESCTLPVKYEIQISEMKDTVWIHASDGSTVGRFGKMGIDMHNTVTQQLQGETQCRLCTHNRVKQHDWDLFVEKSNEFWGVTIPRDSFDSKWFAQ